MTTFDATRLTLAVCIAIVISAWNICDKIDQLRDVIRETLKADPASPAESTEKADG